jgi:hypothetical protein
MSNEAGQGGERCSSCTRMHILIRPFQKKPNFSIPFVFGTRVSSLLPALNSNGFLHLRQFGKFLISSC